MSYIKVKVKGFSNKISVTNLWYLNSIESSSKKVVWNSNTIVEYRIYYYPMFKLWMSRTLSKIWYTFGSKGWMVNYYMNVQSLKILLNILKKQERKPLNPFNNQFTMQIIIYEKFLLNTILIIIFILNVVGNLII